MMKRNSTPEDAFDPSTGEIRKGGSMFRGFFGKMWYMNVFNLLYMLGAFALAGLGAYGAIENLINAFANGTTNSFVCKSPLQG